MRHIFLAILFCSLASASEQSLAEALAATGIQYIKSGRIEQAKDAFYRALAHDENCGTALFQLAKIYEKEGLKNDAANLYSRALDRLKDQQKADAESRVKALNPSAYKLSVAFQEYSRSMSDISSRYSDSQTQDAIAMRLNNFHLKAFSSEKIVRTYGGFPIASIEIEEQMGYGVGILKDKPMSHVGAQHLRYLSIPQELVGLEYALIVVNSVSEVAITFTSDGVIFVLVSKGMSRVDTEKIRRIGKQTNLTPMSDGEGSYGVWAVYGHAGEKFTVAHHPLVALSIVKKAP